ncbi:MAG: PilX N-terminal domain-containing pilus assembly protein [Candidatus Acidiferrales bacterium]
MRNRQELGLALVTALLVLLLVSSMIVGMAWLVMTDQKLGGNNSDRQLAFYGAESGMEAMTANLAADFNANYALSANDIALIQANPPNNIPGIQFLSPTGGSGYQISFSPDPANGGNPLATNTTILSGTYQGLVALLTPYTLTVTARTNSGSEVKLQRVVQTVAIPVFQFGVFSQTDLSFFAGPQFNFGGRVHTNGNLWLAEGDGNTLFLADKVTAVGEVIRTNLENGWALAANYNGTVNINTTPGSANYVALTQAQGSVTGTSTIGAVSTALNEPAFKNLANGTYKGNLGNGYTGVTPLNMTIATPQIGGQPIDMIRLPIPGEDATNPGKLAERYYSQASLRILLSDYDVNGQCAASDITKLPETSANAPVDLATLAWDTSAPGGNTPNAAPGWLTNIGTATFPLPVSAAQAANYTNTDGYWVKKYYPIMTGCIKIDYQIAAGNAWTDVTQEILKLGYTGANLNPQSAATMGVVANQSPRRVALPGAQIAASACLNPSRDAVIRLARVRDNPSFANGVGGCGVWPNTAANQHGTDYWPNVLFDTREAIQRDAAPAGNVLTLAGSMYYVELDVNNLARWFTGAIGASGASANNVTGYSVYFSDRRGDRIDPIPPASIGAGAAKTGAFGYNDIVNPLSVNGCPNAAADQGEDIEGDYISGVDPQVVPVRTFGGAIPAALPVEYPATNALPAWAGAGIQLGNVMPPANATVITTNPNCVAAGNAWPFATYVDARDARENAPMYFHRALKLVNGSAFNIGACDAVNCGLTVIAENPVYVQGNYNAAPNGNYAGAHAASAVIADAVTLLSTSWNDVNSFAFPYNLNNRVAATTTYRIAVMAGKGIPFPQPAGTAQDFGTDGGMHNFLRYIENWGGATLFYRGSLVSMYYNHQAEGIYKCCNTVYSPPTRGYNFDTEFLTPSLLPPRTPMFRDINTIGFTQMILPTQ